MKKLSLTFVLVISFALISCTNMQGNQETTTLPDNNKVENDDSKTGVQPEYLTYDTFIEKVWDFETNPQEWIYKGDVPCVIDFYADWCKPCKLIAPIMEELANEYKGEINVYKVNTEQQRELSRVFGVKSIPAVLFIPMEGQPQMSTGALPKESFKQAIDEFLLGQEKDQ